MAQPYAIVQRLVLALRFFVSFRVAVTGAVAFGPLTMPHTASRTDMMYLLGRLAGRPIDDDVDVNFDCHGDEDGAIHCDG